MDLATIQDHSGVLEDLDLNVNNPLAGFNNYEQEEEEEENPVIYESKVSLQVIWSALKKLRLIPFQMEPIQSTEFKILKGILRLQLLTSYLSCIPATHVICLTSKSRCSR